ncbi:MAG: cobyrinate a,c-diamide synthase [Thermodesulfobacteriota bacterium]
MISSCPRLIVAALRGGCGKTTISLGIISAWRRAGRRIIPFKKGPDYIDAGWLAQAAGRPCFNLDPYLMTPEQIVRSFGHRASGNHDGALIEGNRGLFDGTDEAGTYSTAELAKLLKTPIILVVDCTKATRTLAAVVYGCRLFDPGLDLAGVILNQVATRRQETLVRHVIEAQAGVPVLGAVPRLRDHDLPERHLGLIPHQEHPAATKALDLLAELIKDSVDLKRLETLAAAAPDIDSALDPWTWPTSAGPVGVRIGVIRDSAFQFYYPENLEALERLGARLVVFSSLDADRLPDVDGLYLGGGFPETHAEILAGNQGLRTSIRKEALAGLPIYAECGGLMYLGQSLVLNGSSFPMAGVFPVSFGLEKRPQGHGYVQAEADSINPYFPVGEKLTGHEFHYSRPLEHDPDQVKLALKVDRGHGFHQGRDGLLAHNVLAAYTHLHALTNIRWAESLVRLAAARRSRDVAVEEEEHGP